MVVDKLILEDVLTFVAGIVALGCTTGIIITLIKRRAKPLPLGDVTHRLDEIADRLTHLEHTTDSTAVEVERISEAQRFTARVLADRAGTPALPDKPRGPITPH